MIQGKIYFLYGIRDAAMAEKVADVLEKNGYPCFLQTRDIAPGSFSPGTLIKEIEEASAMVVILGDHTADSHMIEREINFASELHKPIIPVTFMDNAIIKGSLNYYLAYSSIIKLSTEEGWEMLLDAVGKYAVNIPNGSNDVQASGEPEKPYNGNEPYVFISYSHKDKDTVFRVIYRLQQEGFRVWYDEGIDPATEWDENIAQHIVDSGCMVAFLSGSYIASNNCKDEINFARDLDKPRLLVYIEKTKLPLGMSMRLNRLQSIHAYGYKDKEEFYKKLLDASILNICR